MNLPNKLTMARILMVPLFVAAMLIENRAMQIVAAMIFILASVTDYLDGYIARSRGLITDFGKFMDPIADKLLVMAALIGLVAQQRAHPVCVMLILGREFVVSGVRLVAASRGVVIAAGPLGKIKTVLQMIAIVIALFPFAEGGFMWLGGQILLWLSAAVAGWSLVDYIYRNRGVITL